MNPTQNYAFYSLDRIENDPTTETQHTIQNTRYANYNILNLFPETPKQSIQFATSQPAVFPNGQSHGSGLGAANIDADSMLLLKTEQQRALGRLNLVQRPFVAVPYLGRGAGDTTLELQLQQGEIATDRKSVSTIMSQSFMGHTFYPTTPEMEERVTDSRNTVEESALDGWVRGGSLTR
jgi:hypothetical protein